MPTTRTVVTGPMFMNGKGRDGSQCLEFLGSPLSNLTVRRAKLFMPLPIVLLTCAIAISGPSATSALTQPCARGQAPEAGAKGEGNMLPTRGCAVTIPVMPEGWGFIRSHEGPLFFPSREVSNPRIRAEAYRRNFIDAWVQSLSIIRTPC